EGPMGSIEVAGLDGGSITVRAAQLDRLASAVGGRLLAAGDAGWADAVRIWNGMVAQAPALVAQPASAAEVAAAVRFATDHGLLLSVKGGGHNIAGTSIAAGGLTLDMSRLRQVEVDPAARLARAGAGCLLQDVDRATQEHGLATALGFVSETGVAGLTLGGGFGYLSRRFGYAADNLAAAEVVTADGEVRTASADHEPELFWALRGGGANLGVVTRFTFQLHEVGPTITGGLIAWPGERTGEVLATYRALTESAPRHLTAALTVRLAPAAPFIPAEWHGRPIVGMVLCHSGADPEGDLAPVRAVGRPIADLVMEKPYAAQQSMLDATQPKGMHYYWKTEFLPGLPDGFLERFRAAALAVTSPMSQSFLFHIGGALNERPADDGAVGNRDAEFVGGFAGSWPPDDPEPGAHLAWVRGSWEGIRPFSTGGNYVNFQLADDDDARTAAAYGANLGRLRQVKAAYDPANLFRVNRNVSPAQ
ncbi:MAG: FAD-binding oxidoreductase, partial [Acidimicrobiales bacterium]